MRMIKFFIFFTTAGLLLSNGFIYGQVYEFLDDFESHIPDQPLACQDSLDWTTFFGNPCDPVEDPIISTNHSITGTKSVRIIQNNDLVKPFGTHTIGYYYITFWFYIPSGKAGYFSTLAVFNGFNSNWAMECYFDVGGTGRIFGASSNPVTFNWIPNEWQFLALTVDLNVDQARFYLDNNLIHTWQWTDGAYGHGSPLSIEANDFFGVTANDEMYIDNYVFVEPPLTPPPLYGPTNLITEEIYNPYPQVKLTWQDNSNIEYAFNIIRKDGPIFGPGSFEPIGTAPQNATIYIDSTVVVDSTYTYAVFAYNEYGFSDKTNYATIIVVVPVELVSFSYEISKQNNVTLSWITATETNNEGFELFRREVNEEEWQSISFVEGHGTTTEISSYTYADKNLNSGNYNYRLKQIDFNGSFTYYNLEETVEISPPLKFELSQNYPNPFNPSTKIKFSIPSVGTQRVVSVQLKVYDVLGNEVATLVNEEKPAGEYEVEFFVGRDSRPDIASGIYFYQLKTGSFVETKKMILLK